MQIYLLLILIVSLFCLGLRAITDSGMIGYPVREYFFDKAPYWGKPIVLCPACMTSLWGTIIYWGYTLTMTTQVEFFHFPCWIGVCISSSFVSAFCWAYYEKMFFEMD